MRTKGPRQLVASCSSWPCFEMLPSGAMETPGVVPEDVELAFFGLEGLDGGFDGC